MYTNVFVSDAIDIALKLYTTDYAPDIERSTLKLQLKLAVTNNYFKSNGKWYCQKDGLAMGASLAVILANIWMQSFEGVIKDEKDGITQIPKMHLKKVRNSAKNLFGTVKVLNVKNVKTDFMLSVQTSVKTKTKKWVI